MYLAAKYCQTYPTREAAMNVLNRLAGVEVQAQEADKHSADFVLLDAKINQGATVAPGHFILLTTLEGVELYFASGLHLSSTVEGAEIAFASGYIDQVIEDEPIEPVVCRIFEFNYWRAAHVFH